MNSQIIVQTVELHIQVTALLLPIFKSPANREPQKHVINELSCGPMFNRRLHTSVVSWMTLIDASKEATSILSEQETRQIILLNNGNKDQCFNYGVRSIGSSWLQPPSKIHRGTNIGR